MEKIIAPKADEPLRHPPIFILGPPRSGSTLMIQVITDALDVGYISNRHCRWFGAPALAEYLYHPLSNKPLSDYRSNHGTTCGAYAPAECGSWWYRFFRRNPPYVTSDDVDPIKMQEFRCSIAALTNALDKPVLFKNLYASLRIQPIAKYIPESLFIVIHRNEVDNGHSLLEARYKSFKNYTPWFSVEPHGIKEIINLPPYKQVIEQIRHIHMVINQDMQRVDISPKRRFDLNYEKFCYNPSEKINAIQSFLESHGCRTTRRSYSIPEHFNRRNEIRIDQKLYQAMKSYSKE
ncbi:MAG: sulfotransferase [Candidatus Electrothrix sp. YB6]